MISMLVHGGSLVCFVFCGRRSSEHGSRCSFCRPFASSIVQTCTVWDGTNSQGEGKTGFEGDHWHVDTRDVHDLQGSTWCRTDQEARLKCTKDHNGIAPCNTPGYLVWVCRQGMVATCEAMSRTQCRHSYDTGIHHPERHAR